MNRLVLQRSTWWPIASWLIVAFLTADAINLDDLVPGVYVAHDEIEVSSPAPGFSITRPGVLAARQRSSKFSTTRSGANDKSGTAARIVFDEDSPSEAAKAVESSLHPIAFNTDEQSAVLERGGSESPLHLLHCMLLI